MKTMACELVLLREFDNDLIDRLTAIEAEAFGDGGLNRWTFPVFIRHGAVYVFQKGEEILGVADVIRDWLDPELVFIVGFLVKREFRGQGIGSLFLSELIGALRSDGARLVQLTVDDKNGRALRLYRKAGFREVAELPGEYGPGVDRLLLELELEG